MSGKPTFSSALSRALVLTQSGLISAALITRPHRSVSDFIFCLKEWHITEIEEADTFFTFYSMAIKAKATKRIGAYLGLKESEYLSLET